MRAEHHRDHVRATIKGRETECPTDRTPRPWTQLAWNAERRPQKKPHNPCPRTGGRASSYPLAQHQYRNEVPQHHHRDLPSSQAVCHSSVLNHQHGCGCGKFGMKRPRTPEKYGHERNASRTRAPTSSCAAQGFRDGRRRLSRGFARQGQWTRYDSIRLPDRALAALVQSACNKPGSRLITHDHVRSGPGAWMAGPCRIPKLTVRVRFPSPAANAKSVATHGDSLTPFSVIRRLGTSKNGVNDPRTICGPHTGHRLQYQHRSSGSQFPVSVRRWREWANNC